MDWINPEAFGLGCPLLANELIRRQALERLESSPEVVGSDEVSQMLLQLLVIVVMKALDGSFFDGPVHSLNLPVGPRMFDLGKAMFNAVLGADAAKNMIASPPITRTVHKLDARPVHDAVVVWQKTSCI